MFRPGPYLTPDVRNDLAELRPFHETSMHLAVTCRNERALELMMRAGADCTFGNRNGVTVLQFAVLYGSPTMVRMLLAHVPLNRWTLLGEVTEHDLIPMAFEEVVDDYSPYWAGDKDDPSRPPNFFRERAANVDLVLWATRGLWTCEELIDYIRRAKEEMDSFIPEVMQVVQGHLQWTDARRTWLQAVVRARARFAPHDFS